MKVGIIGGSGLYDLDGLADVREERLNTPFGEPSDAFICGTIGEREVCFLPRHGRGHRILPSEINHKANICGFKLLGCEAVLSISAVGSLKEGIHPRDIVLPDQYFDRTKGSLQHTFFGNGIVAHISFGQPSCEGLRGCIAEAVGLALAEEGSPVQLLTTGTYVNMEGPAFSTKAESAVYRMMGFDIIGMTSLPEAKLCREAEMCYQAVAMVTDYDCWHETEGPVSVDKVIEHLHANTTRAKRILTTLIPRLDNAPDCPCRHALKSALLTSPDAMPADTKEKLRPILGRYL